MKKLSKKLVAAIGMKNAMSKWLRTHPACENWDEAYGDIKAQEEYVHNLCGDEGVFSMPYEEYDEFLSAYCNAEKFEQYCSKYGYAA